MYTFEEIEEKFAAAHVRVCGKDDLAGILRIAKRDTTIDLLSSEFFHLEGGDHGWFDLEMIGPDGAKFFAHNALSSGTGNRSGRDRQTLHFASVHPNILVMDSNGLDANRHVAAVRFHIEGIENFFHYQYTEPLDCFGMSEEARATLLDMRYNPEQPKDFAAPDRVFIVHELGEVLDFKVEERRYRIWMGGNGGFGSWHRIRYRVFPIAAISFDEPVTIDEALDRIWEWRRFFVQLAMQHLSFEGIGFLANHDDRAAIGSVYLPNTDRRKRERGYYELHPAYIPLNRWGDRERLAGAMQTWLKRDGRRRAFRARLDRVLDNMNRRMDQMDLVELSAGIDSLNELDSKTKFPSGTVDAMVEAAGKAAEGQKVGIDPGRLRGILSQLQRRSLAEKMKELGRRAMPDADFKDIELVVATARKCRDDAAHRGAVSEQREAHIGPAVEALASMCVAFDLCDAGVPRRTSNDAQCFWAIRFRDAVAELKRMQAS
ncbi:hypothetical protein [Novosphingobium beihaiensis]|uniref:ApeA N-terminal domain-containing protein n=1 Tax=Novosphingobium beihaiensis TaxID=2930389 RepID=A0ABT0BWJ6_9SPHN|nr:hypothetical protein [Novosphingobium beihaiensis]MCJ2189029.1 hypothetical protein [Novosphingobium beihaiensis]